MTSKPMTKPELINKLAESNPNMLIKDIEAIVSVFFETIAGSLASGKRVEMRGFGVFFAKYREGRKARNPRTGEEVDVPGKYSPFFKAGKQLRDMIDTSKPS